MFDNTKLVAVNTCPLWGIVRYGLHKTFQGVGRAMALEAGAAAHEVFAAHRLFQFRQHANAFYGMADDEVERLFHLNGRRIFGQERFDDMCAQIDPRENELNRMHRFALQALFNCGFYDDPRDKRRTMSNIEELAMIYMDRFDWSDKLPVLVTSDVLGIEVPVDVVVQITYEEKNVVSTRVLRFIGKADGIHWTDPNMNTMRVHENKTASRLGEAWEMSWETNHQPTGYMIALSAMLSFPINEAMILGTALPMPKTLGQDGVSRVIARRTQEQIVEWCQWVVHTIAIYLRYVATPLDAPRYTHSCNRYFRPCSFVGLCSVSRTEAEETLADMTTDEWNPLKQLESNDE